MKWIKTIDQLPPKDKQFLVFTSGVYYILKWHEDCAGNGEAYWNGIEAYPWEIIAREYNFNDHFDYWMELTPSPQK